MIHAVRVWITDFTIGLILCSFSGQLRGRPVGYWKIALRRLLAGERNDLCNLLGKDLQRAAARTGVLKWLTRPH